MLTLFTMKILTNYDRLEVDWVLKVLIAINDSGGKNGKVLKRKGGVGLSVLIVGHPVNQISPCQHSSLRSLRQEQIISQYVRVRTERGNSERTVERPTPELLERLEEDCDKRLDIDGSCLGAGNSLSIFSI